jgi:hypothetical protein
LRKKKNIYIYINPNTMSKILTNLRILGSLQVDGTATYFNSENVSIADNYIFLNKGYTTAIAQSGGIVMNNIPTATTDTSAGAFVAGVAATSNPTVATTGSNVFAQHDIIQINGTGEGVNDGLFEVESHTANVLTLKGVGTIPTLEDFTQSQLAAETTNGVTITKVSVAVFSFSTGGNPEIASGSTTGAGGLLYTILSQTGHSHVSTDITDLDPTIGNHIKAFESTYATPSLKLTQDVSYTTITDGVDDTSISLGSGTYRVTFQGQYTIEMGTCECKDDFETLATELKNNTFQTHAAAFVTETLVPGFYKTVGATTHDGIITLNGQGDEDSVFIIWTTGAHTVTAAASIVLTGSAKACNVFYIIEGALSVGANCTMIGTYLGYAALGSGAGLNLVGRFISILGAIAFDGGTVSLPAGVSQHTLGRIVEFLAYTHDGAISNTGTITTQSGTWKVESELGTITGFGEFNGTFPLNFSGILVSFAIHQDNVVCPSSVMYAKHDSFGEYYSVNTACSLVATGTEVISIKARVHDSFGGLVIKNRSLFIAKFSSIE